MNGKRLTTEDPQGNYEWMHNLTTVKNREVYLREWNNECDVNLVDFCKAEYKKIYGNEPNVSTEEFGELMDGDDLLSAFYWMAVGYAELRNRLKQYEDTGLSPQEIEKSSKMKFIKLTNVVQFENLTEGDYILVRWSNYSCKHHEDMKKIMCYPIAEVRIDQSEIICRVKGNHYFNYDRYLKGLSGAEEVLLVVEG